MRTFITMLSASALSLAAFNAAQAADAIDQIPQAPVSEYSEPAIGNWAGAYAGGTASWQRGDLGGAEGSAIGGGIYGGYNMQSGQIVYGGEADLNYSGLDSRNTTAGIRTDQGVNGSVRGRVGIDLNPVLLYGTAGVAAANIEVRDRARVKDDRTALGWTAGVGAEAFVTNNITTRIEYRYTDYQKKNYDLSAGKVRAGADDHSIRVGLGVKF